MNQRIGGAREDGGGVGEVQDEDLCQGNQKTKVGGVATSTKGTVKVIVEEPAKLELVKRVVEAEEVQDKDLCHGGSEGIQGVEEEERRRRKIKK